MKHINAKKLLILVALCLAAPSALSQHFSIYGNQNRPEDVFFLTDYAAFQSDSTDGVRLEVYYQIHNPILRFMEEDDLYVAEYLLTIDVHDDDDNLVGSFRRNRTVKAPSRRKAVSHSDYRTNQVNFELDPGKYKVDIALRDINGEKQFERDFKTKLKKFRQKTARLSDIELIQAAGAQGDEPSKFDKGNLTMIPSVSTDFGENNVWKLKYYTEIYQGADSLEDVRIETVVRHRLRGMLYRDSLTSSFNDGVIRELREISLDDLKPGDYELGITLIGKRKKKIDFKSKNFSLTWSERAYMKFDYETTLNQLRIIADNNELKGMEDLEEFADRVRAFDAFWLARDPSPGTPENELKREFYRRVRVANANFRSFTTSGWKTDRGRVYVLFGEPDQVDDYPLVPNYPPYQEWHYYRGSRYRRFVFVDADRDGDYRLQYPFDGLNLRPEF